MLLLDAKTLIWLHDPSFARGWKSHPREAFSWWRAIFELKFLPCASLSSCICSVVSIIFCSIMALIISLKDYPRCKIHCIQVLTWLPHTTPSDKRGQKGANWETQSPHSFTPKTQKSRPAIPQIYLEHVNFKSIISKECEWTLSTLGIHSTKATSGDFSESSSQRNPAFSFETQRERFNFMHQKPHWWNWETLKSPLAHTWDYKYPLSLFLRPHSFFSLNFFFHSSPRAKDSLTVHPSESWLWSTSSRLPLVQPSSKSVSKIPQTG